MISYETYKLLHLIFIMTFFASLGLVASSSTLIKGILGKVLVGLVSFLILVVGMGLVARLGFKHGQAFPLWISLKIGLWFFINVLLVYLFKLKSNMQKGIVLAVILIMGWIAVWVIINKPL